MADSFTHLHVHTEFSMLDGAARVGDVVAKAAADGQPAVGITDHGNMYGILDFYKACQNHGVKPVLGSELYQAFEKRTERPSRRGRQDDTGGDADGGRKAYYHLTALAETNTGYRNLIQLSSRAYLEGYYMKPKVDWEVLEDHHEGLIVTSGCLGGQVLQALVPSHIMEPDKGLADPFTEDERFRNALDIAGRFQDIFGRDNFFIEIQDHGIGAQGWSNPHLIRLAQKLRAPLLATNDSHYTHQHDHEAHDALLCVQTGSLMSDTNRFKFHGDQHYFKSAAEMRHLFADVPEACDNTLWIAERADVQIEFGKPKLPNFPLPEGFADDAEYLEHLTFEGARERWGATLPDEVTERLAYELKVIGDMGFSSYFLIVWDLIRHAKESGIRVGPGRGSAAGCAVAYCLRITDLDPIRYDLLFERFLNPSRISMPDIDMDFDSRYRDEMIRYAAEMYGRDHVAQIVTFSTIKARAAVRDAARVLGYPYVVGDKVAKAMPPLIMGRDTPLWACMADEAPEKYEDGYKMAGELRQMYAEDPDAHKVIDVARGLEGLRRQDGIHAAAVVITKDPLTEYLPIQRKPEPGQDPEAAPVVTQYEMGGVEELGLLKMDFLGLRNLDVITDAVEMIRRTRGVEVDIDNVDLDDKPTFDLLQKGDTVGVFQLEGGAMRTLMRSLAPTEFDDVGALVALYRPGPMAANVHTDYADRKNARKPVAFLHDDAEEVLGSTYGLCLTGDTVVFDAVTGLPVRLDEIGGRRRFFVQGVTDDLMPAIREVSAWRCNGEQDTVELTLVNGMSLRGTPDHRVLTDVGWREIGSLTDADHVAVPRALSSPVTPTAVSPERLRLAGYLIADGSLSCRASVVFTNTEAELLDAFITAACDAFPGVHCSTSVRKPGVMAVTVGNGRGNGGGPSGLLRWLREIGLKAPAGVSPGGPRSAEKRVPSVVFGCDEDGVATFLGALWDCDGHVNRRLAHYRTISRQLALDVQLLLLRLGIESTIHSAVTPPTSREPSGGVAYQVTVYDGAPFRELVMPRMALTRKRTTPFGAVSRGTTIDRRTFQSALREATGGAPTRVVAAQTGIARSHLMPYAVRSHPRVYESSIAEGVAMLAMDEIEQLFNVQWVRVETVEDAGRSPVYDITVEEINNFVANGLVTHNCVYQEQIMRLAQRFAGYTLAEADNLRKACGKKKRDLIAKERAKFVEGCEATGYGRELGEAWFDIIEPFADYAFNKSHSYGYGFVAYQTAYLKANYPVEYLACLLTSVKSTLEKAAVYLAECRAMGIPVLVPDINVSESDFTALIDAETGKGSIPFGLSAVRNVGEGLVELMLAEREANGPFVDFYDFCERVDPAVLNKRTVESLIKAGGFDAMGHPRQGLLMVYESIIDRVLARRRKEAEGQFELFDLLDGGGSSNDGFDDARIDIPTIDFDKRTRLSFEKEMLGLYVSDHPLMGAEGSLRKRTDGTLTDLEMADDGAIRKVGGLVTNLQRKWTKRGDLMAVFVLEDLQTSIEVMVFPKTMASYGHMLEDDAVVVMKCRVDKREDTPKLIASDVEVLSDLGNDAAPPVRINIHPARASEALLADLKSLLHEHPGESAVFLHLGDDKVLRLPPTFAVEASTGLLAELRVLLGAQAVSV